MMRTIGRKARSSALPAAQIDLTIGYHVKDSECGAALVVALIVMALLAMLTMGTLDMLTTNVQIASNHAHEFKASYIADAGVEDVIDRLRDDPTWDTGLLDVEFPAGSGNTYTVSVDNSDYPSIIIAATGTAANFQRFLEVKVRISGASPPYSVAVNYWKET